MMTYEGLGAELPRTLDRNRPNVVSERPWTHAASLEILTDVLDRVRLKGTVIFHYGFGRSRGARALKHNNARSARR